MSKKSDRKGRLTASSDVLQTLLQNGKSPLSQGFTRWRVWKEWSTIVGKEIASRTEPVEYKQGILFLWVKSSAHMQEVNFFSGEIRNKVNGYLKKKWVNRIRYTLDKNKVVDRDQVEGHLKQLFRNNFKSDT